MLEALILWLAAKHPWIMWALISVGALRFINKPLFAFLQAFVVITPWKWDNELLKKIEASLAYRALCFILDWLGSIKLRK